MFSAWHLSFVLGKVRSEEDGKALLLDMGNV
jgi:hypothetical protein